MKEGLEPYTRYPVDKYKLDFAFIKGDKKLNVEIDGEEYHKIGQASVLEEISFAIIDSWGKVGTSCEYGFMIEDYSDEYIQKIKKYLA